MGKLSAKYQFCAIHTADNTDGKVTGGGKMFTAGNFLSRHRYSKKCHNCCLPDSRVETLNIIIISL